MVRFVFLCAVLVLFLILSCLSRGDPGGYANIENHEKNRVRPMNLLGCPFCANCKENKFQSTGARQTARKTSPETAPATCRNMLQKLLILVPKMVPKSLPEACRRPLAPQEAAKSSKPRPKIGQRTQERPKSVPKRLKGQTTFPGKGSAGLGPDRWGGVGEG